MPSRRSCAATTRCSEEIARTVQGQAAPGVGSVTAVKGGDRDDGTTAGRYLENRAVNTPAAQRNCAEEIAVLVEDHPGIGVGTVAAVEGSKGGDGAAACYYLEYRPIVICAAELRRAKEIAAAVNNEAALRGALGSVESGERGDGAAARLHLEYRPLI